MKLIVNKGLRCPNKGEYVRFKNYEKIIKPPFVIYADFESVLVQKIMGSKIQISHIRTNMKTMLLATMAMN